MKTQGETSLKQAHQETDEKVIWCDTDTLLSTQVPLLLLGTGLLLGISQTASQPHLQLDAYQWKVSKKDVCLLENQGPSTLSPVTNQIQKNDVPGMMKPKWKRLLYFCTKGSNLLTRTSALHNWISNKQTVFEPLYNLGSFTIAV